MHKMLETLVTNINIQTQTYQIHEFKQISNNNNMLCSYYSFENKLAIFVSYWH